MPSSNVVLLLPDLELSDLRFFDVLVVEVVVVDDELPIVCPAPPPPLNAVDSDSLNFCTKISFVFESFTFALLIPPITDNDDDLRFAVEPPPLDEDVVVVDGVEFFSSFIAGTVNLKKRKKNILIRIKR